MKHLIWAASVAASVVAISYWTAQANIEADKQSAFMMRACVDAGGLWLRQGWSTYYNCERPK